MFTNRYIMSSSTLELNFPRISQIHDAFDPIRSSQWEDISTIGFRFENKFCIESSKFVYF